MTKLLLDEHPIAILPSLAQAIGLHEAVVLQQMHYWLKKSAHAYEGRQWVFNTYKQWHEQLPFMSEKQVRTAIERLESLGLIEHGHFNKKGYDRTKWYTINYTKVDEFGKLSEAFAPQGNSICPTGQKHLPHRAIPFAPQGRPIPETTTETTTETTQKEEYSQEFMEWWSGYPRKDGKRETFRCWKARLKDGVSPLVLTTGRDNYRDYVRTQGTEDRFIKLASTFIGPDKPYEEWQEPRQAHGGSNGARTPNRGPATAVASYEKQLARYGD